MKTYFATNPLVWYRHAERLKPHETIPGAYEGEELVVSYKMIVNDGATAYDSFALLLGRGWIPVSVQKPMSEKTREYLADEVRRGNLYESASGMPTNIQYSASSEL